MNEQINRLRALIALADGVTEAQASLTTAHVFARQQIGGAFIDGYNSAVAALVSIRGEAFAKVRAEFNAAVADMDEASRTEFHTRVWKK